MGHRLCSPSADRQSILSLAASTLASQIQMRMVPVNSESMAVMNFAQAYSTYCGDATANNVALSSNAAHQGEAAMIPAMTGLSQPGAAAAAIQAGCIAFWLAIVANATTAFKAATLVTPPPCAGIATALQAVFLSNQAGKLDLNHAATQVAQVLHAQTLLGGSVSYPGPLVAPIL